MELSDFRFMNIWGSWLMDNGHNTYDEIMNMNYHQIKTRFQTVMKETKIKMYSERNFKTKKELKEAVAKGDKIGIYAPGLGTPKENGTEFLEGPHYPEAHKWYAEVEIKDGIIVQVK